MSKRHRFRVDDLSRLLVYVLAHRPDEFGLVPDGDGFVPVKRLLQALREEPGRGHVGEGLLREVLLSEHRDHFETEGARIRAKERRFRLDLDTRAEPPGGLLFAPIRKRAHPHVLEHGLKSRTEGHYVLSMDREMALRIGRRVDASPVILEVRIPDRGKGLVPLFAFGDLYLATEIPAEDIMGPPLSRDQQKAFEKREKTQPEEKKTAGGPAFDAGTFVLKPERDPDRFRREGKGRKRRTWKETSRKLRRKK